MPMHGFLVLFKTMLRHYFGLSVLRERLRKREQLLNTFLPALGVIALGTLFVYGYTRFLLNTYTVSVQLQQPGLILLFGLLTVQVIVLFFGFFYMISVFYYSSDMEFLVPLPLQPRAILIAKFGIVLLTEYVTALPLALPPIIIYGLQQGSGILYWLAATVIVILLPLLPLALAGAFAILLMRFTNLARHRDALRVISGLLSVFIAIWMQYNVAKLDAVDEDLNMLMMNIISMPNSLVNMVGNRFPPSLWGASALINTGGGALGYFLLYVGTAVAAFALLSFIGQRFFYTGLLAGNAHPSLKHGKQRAVDVALAKRPALTALIVREWQGIVRHPVFAMTAGMNLLLPPVLVALPILGGGEQFVNIGAAVVDPRFLVWGSIAIAGLYTALAAISTIPATAISREGKQFWISQILPVAPALQVWAKLLFSVSVTAASGLLILAVAAGFLGLPWNIIAIGTLLGIPALVMSCALCLCADCLWPHLDWANPQQAMKGNQNSLIAMLAVGVVVFGVVRLLFWVVGLGWSHAAILGFTFAVLVVLAFAATRVMVSLANRLYTPLSSEKGGALESLRAISGRKIRAAVYVLAILAVVGSLSIEFFKGRNLDYTLTAGAVEIGSTTIPYGDITEVRYLEKIPTLSNRVGTSVGNYKSGTFTVEGIGRGKVYAKDSTQPAVAIFTADTFYIITPENAREFYYELQQQMDSARQLE
jgi:ABC-2 type transport system permease protein